jgi:hypothetical protein
VRPSCRFTGTINHPSSPIDRFDRFDKLTASHLPAFAKCFGGHSRAGNLHPINSPVRFDRCRNSHDTRDHFSIKRRRHAMTHLHHVDGKYYIEGRRGMIMVLALWVLAAGLVGFRIGKWSARRQAERRLLPLSPKVSIPPSAIFDPSKFKAGPRPPPRRWPRSPSRCGGSRMNQDLVPRAGPGHGPNKGFACGGLWRMQPAPSPFA